MHGLAWSPGKSEKAGGVTRRHLWHLRGARVLDPRPVLRPGARVLRSGPLQSLGCASAAIALRDHCRRPMDPDRHRRALGRQEPVLRILPVSGFVDARRQHAVLESVSLRRPSQRRRSAIADLRAGLHGMGVVRRYAIDGCLRPDGSCPPARWRPGAGAMGWRMGWPLPASLLAGAVFMLGGPASGRLQHTSMILSYAMFPPALLLLSLALQRRSIPIAAAFAAVAAMLTLERNHASLLLCFTLAAVWPARSSRQWSGDAGCGSAGRFS